MTSWNRDTEEFDRAESGGDPELDQETDERPGAVVASARDGGPEDETVTFEPVPGEEDSRDESAAAAWAAGATPPGDAIPDHEHAEQAGSTDEAAELQPSPAELAPDPEVQPSASDPGDVPVEAEAGSFEHFGNDGEDPLDYSAPGTDAEVFSAPPEGGAELAPAPRADELVTERGRTTISDTVVEKIAGKAASEVEGVGGVRSYGLSRLASLFSSEEDGRKTKADAAVDRGSTQVDLAISVRYPEPVGNTAELVRDHVRARVQELTGLEVAAINITVPELVPPPPPKPQPRVL